MAKLIRLSGTTACGVLEHYDIGEYKGHKHIPWALSNSVYYLYTTKGRFVLKIHENVSAGKIKYAQKMMGFAKRHGIPVPPTVMTREGKQFALCNGKYVTIQKFVAGSASSRLNEATIINAAKVIGKLDKALLGYDKGRGKIRVEEINLVNTPQDARVLGFDFSKAKASMRDELRSIDMKKLRQSTIHGDLGGNILYENNRISTILDWEDAGKSYIAKDPAVFISHNFVSETGVMRENIALFLSVYQKYVKLNAEEIKALHYFVRHRFLSAVLWITKQLQTRRNRGFLGYERKLLRAYSAFSKVPMEEFLSLADHRVY